MSVFIINNKEINKEIPVLGTDVSKAGFYTQLILFSTQGEVQQSGLSSSAHS